MGTTNFSTAFATTPNAAQYDGADWSLQVNRMNGISLNEAYTFAYANDAVTYFFRVPDGAQLVLPIHGTFGSGDTVFFSGNPWFGPAPGLANAYTKNAGAMNHMISPSNYFTRLRGKFDVPLSNPSTGILYLWPGLQPGNLSGNAADAIGNGVLQPVLTYDAGADNCAPNPTHIPFQDNWWISGQYVNTDYTSNTPPQFQGCHGGPRLALTAGQTVDIDMSYNEADMSWTQTCSAGGNTVSYNIALTIDGQVQNQAWALMISEPYGGAAIVGAISMYDLEFKTASPCPGLLAYLGSLPQASGARQGVDAMHVLVDRIVFHSPA